MRLDARDKATGRTRYVADLAVPGMCHVALVRSGLPHATIDAIRKDAAEEAEGVVRVVTASDVSPRLFGRRVRDVPLLARERTRYVGEPVAAVVAETRRAAESAATLVEVTYGPLPFISTLDEALEPDAPLVHESPWKYEGAVTEPGSRNLQSQTVVGSAGVALAALDDCAHRADLTFRTPSGHQGYLETQSCIASFEGDRLKVWLTNKAPYAARRQLADVLDMAEDEIVLMPVPVGGDFGGKGSLQQAPLCAELSRLVGRPVKLVLRFDEDLVAGNPRHPSRIRVRLGCDQDGTFVAAHIEAFLNGGAYAGFKPRKTVDLGGIHDSLHPYRVPDAYVDSRILYTNTVPRGHMRSPGHPQGCFAVESAIDELARLAGLNPIEIRRRNLVGPGEAAFDGALWAPGIGDEVLVAAKDIPDVRLARPVVHGWRLGRGLAMCLRTSAVAVNTSLRLTRMPEDRVLIEVPVPETGTGNHTVIRDLLSESIQVPADRIDVVHVSTDELPNDAGVGHSRITVSIAAAMPEVADRWSRHEGDAPLLVEVSGPLTGDGRPLVSYCVQVADVAVDDETGQIKVLGITSIVDVGRIVNETAHQLQVDGGVVMGLGFATMEDLQEKDGQVWAGNLGEFRIPTSEDVPRLATTYVRGSDGEASALVKPIGELTNVAVGPAIANAVRAATGCRLTEVPLHAESVYWALREGTR